MNSLHAHTSTHTSTYTLAFTLAIATILLLGLSACGGSTEMASGDAGESGNGSCKIDGKQWEGTAFYAVDYDYEEIKDAVAVTITNYGNNDAITLVFEQKKPSSGTFAPDVFSGHSFMLESGGRTYTSDDAKSDATIAITGAGKKGLSGKFSGTVYAGEASKTIKNGQFKNVPISK